MNTQQMNAAKNALSDWLAHPQELGKAPAKIECAGTFELHDMLYYIFKYKKGLLGKWLLGVAGGYEGDDLQHCGHVFSEMQEYVEASAQEDAIKLVELVRSYWINKAEEIEKRKEDAEKRKENAGTFVNFVLLKDAKWEEGLFAKALADDWQVSDESGEERGDDEEHPGTLVLKYHDYMIAVSLVDAPVPDGEAEYYAQRNYRWRNAVEVTQTHKAHLMVAVMGKGKSPMEAGELLVKAVMACLKSADVVGIYGSETVFEPNFYMQFGEMMKEGMFPLFNLVWFGLYKSDKGFSAYTSGLASFGKDEVEIIDSKAEPNEIGEFISDIANYVLEYDVTLNDGETIGFSEDQKLSITRSQGVAVEGMSLKIEF